MNFHRSEEGLKSAEIGLVDLVEKSSNLYCDDASTLYNDNLRANLSLQAAIRLCLAATRSAMERKESEGAIYVKTLWIKTRLSSITHSSMQMENMTHSQSVKDRQGHGFLLLNSELLRWVQTLYLKK